MPDTTIQSAKSHKKSRLGNSKGAQRRLARYRAVLAQRRRLDDKLRERDPTVVQARAELEAFVAGGISNYDSRVVASRLLATAVQEARTFLSPTALLTALFAVSVLEKTDDVNKVDEKIKFILEFLPADPESYFPVTYLDVGKVLD